MARRLPPLNALRAFEAGARHLSFTKAAEELFVTQAAVSHQVKLLEQNLGVQLFRRMTRKLALTAEGRRLIGWVTVWADSQRAGMATIPIFFLIGMILLWPLKDPGGRGAIGRVGDTG